MMPLDCPAWEYTDVPNTSEAIANRCIAFLVSLRRGKINHVVSACETRPIHSNMFEGTTPESTPYYAGHYRGEKFRCLRSYEVMVGGDPRVGISPDRVLSAMSNLTDNIIRAGVSAVSVGHALPSNRVSDEEKLYYVVVFACKVLVEFLRIHPYANGNGHMGRFIVWLILSKFGYWPKRWPLNERPQYVELIRQYRDGSPTPLEEFVLRCI